MSLQTLPHSPGHPSPAAAPGNGAHHSSRAPARLVASAGKLRTVGLGVMLLVSLVAGLVLRPGSGANPALALVVGTWQTKASLAIEGAAASVIGNKLYVSHGSRPGDSAALSIYDIATDTWWTAPSASVARSELVGATAGGKHYAIGGKSSSVVLKVVEIYDPATTTWTRGPDMPTARAGLGAATIGDKIYVLGGRTGTAPHSGSPLSANEVLDTATMTWSTRQPMPQPMMDVYATAAIGGRVYVFGGYAAGVKNTVQIYDPAINSWALGAPMPMARSNAAVGVIGSRAFVIGGVNNSMDNLKVNEVYDPATNLWDTATFKPTAGSEFAAGAIASPSHIFLVGSGIMGTSMSIHEVFSPTPTPTPTPTPPPMARTLLVRAWQRPFSGLVLRGPTDVIVDSIAGTPSVIKDSGLYKMWYSVLGDSGQLEVRHATSTNGVNWTAIGTVLTGTAGSWDSDSVGSPSVYLDEGVFRMWYTGVGHDQRPAIGYATSTDGLNWAKHPRNPVLTGDLGTFEDTGVLHSSVLWDAAEALWKMWYTGRAETSGGSVGTLKIGYATSLDGIMWIKHATNPVMEAGPQGSWDSRGVGIATVRKVAALGFKFIMYYTGYSGAAGSLIAKIGSATSTDGISWGSRQLAWDVGPTGSWDGRSVGSPFWLMDGEKALMWYSGVDASLNVSIGLAISYTTIRAALAEASAAGDTILVHPGTDKYQLVVDKSVVIRSTDGPAQTIIDADRQTTTSAGGGYPAVWIKADNVTLQGFTVKNAAPTDGARYQPIGLSLEGSNNQVEKNVITSHGLGIILGAVATDNVIHFNDIVGNSEGGITKAGGTPVDAIYNWYGDASGPGGLGAGKGDAVAGVVNYSPFLTKIYGDVLAEQKGYLGFDIGLPKGWQGLVTPFRLKDSTWGQITRRGALLPNSLALNYDIAYRFNSATQAWEQMLDADPVVPLQGYMVLMKESDRVVLWVNDGAPTSPPSRTLEEGWALTGPAEAPWLSPRAAGEMLATAWLMGLRVVSPALGGQPAWDFIVSNPDPNRIVPTQTAPFAHGRVLWVYAPARLTITGATTTPISNLSLPRYLLP